MINIDRFDSYNDDDINNYLFNLNEIAIYYSFLHTYEYKYNSRLSTYTIIPLIIISTFAGTATIFQPYVDPDNQSLYLIIIGCSNIIAGLLTLFREYIRILNMQDGINYVAIPFQQLSRSIKLHMALPKEERNDDKEFIKICKTQFDRLIESSPSVSKYVLDKIQKKYKENNVNLNFERI